MVKIVDVEELHGAGSDDDDCCEIGLDEFAKKLNLKEDDDVILVASKGKIVKVENDRVGDFAKASDDYGSAADRSCFCSSVDTDDKGQRVAASDCIDNTFKIHEDETRILIQVEIDEDRFVIDKPSAKLQADDHKDREFFHGDRDTVDVIPSRLVVKREPGDSNGHQVIPEVPVVKCETVGGDSGVEVAGEGSYDHCLEVEMAPERRIFDEDVVVV